MTEEQFECLKNYKRPDECFSLNFHGTLFDCCTFLTITFDALGTGRPANCLCMVLDKAVQQGKSKCTDYDFSKKLIEIL